MDDIYIRMEAALEALCADCTGNCGGDKWMCPDYQHMSSISAADVRSVVLCKDCGFRRDSPVLYCGRTDGLNNITLTDFCSKGRKDGNV